MQCAWVCRVLLPRVLRPTPLVCLPLPLQVGTEVPGLWGRRVCRPTAQACDAELAKALWVKTEETIAAARARA